jgi:hypothetical protein
MKKIISAGKIIKKEKTNNNPDEMPSLFIACQFHQKWVLFLIFSTMNPGYKNI